MTMHLTLITPAEELTTLFAVERQRMHHLPRYNIVPGNIVAALWIDRHKRRLSPHTWGIVSDEHNLAHAGKGLTEVRGESIRDLVVLADHLAHDRSAVIVNGFYLWQAGDDAQRPWYIHRRDDRPLAMAAIRDELWTHDHGAVEACALITVSAGPRLAQIYHRVPAILAGVSLDRWLDPATPVDDDLMSLCVPWEDPVLEAHRVRPEVRNYHIDSAELIKPLV